MGMDAGIIGGGKGIPLAVPTAGDGEEVRLPGDDVEHASYGDAGQRAIEATQPEVDGVKGCRESEGWGRRQAEGCAGRVGPPTSPKALHSPQPRPVINTKVCIKRTSDYSVKKHLKETNGLGHMHISG